MKTSPKPAARKGAPKRESEEQARAARERKRAAKRKGLKAGSRHGEATQDDKAKRAGQQKDPRVGSRKPVSLAANAPAKPKPKAKPVTQAKPDPAALEKELLAIENDERLSGLLDRLDEGQPISSEEQDWVEAQLARHQILMAELGLDEEADDEAPADEAEHSEALWQRFMEDNFDPNALGDDPRKGK